MMDFLYQMNNQQLAKRILSYINRTEALQKQVSDILDQHVAHSKEAVMEEYRALKQAIRDDARQARRREFYTNDPVRMNFQGNITEASAEGFRMPVGSRINQRLYSSIADGHYKLTKYCSKEQWEALAEE